MSLLTKLFGSYSEKELTRIKPLLDKTLGYEEEFKNLSEEEQNKIFEEAGLLETEGENR